MSSSFIENLFILGLAFIIDFLFGEPPVLVHPTVWMGRIISFLKLKFKSLNSRKEKINGILIWLLCFLIFIPSICIILIIVKKVNYMLYIFVVALLLKPAFAVKSWSFHINPLIKALKEENIIEARKLVGKIVGRNTKELSKEQVTSAAIETIAEGIVDGVASPIFYFAIFGLPGAWAFRLANTFDSMIGYRNSEHINIGWFSAKIDTLLNFLPARLSAITMLLACLILKRDWKFANRILIRDKNLSLSVNSGWPMAAMAGILKVRLEKPKFYILGKELRPPTIEDIFLALKVMHLTIFLFILIFVVPITFLLSII
ncbi:cobalamin biosynthesis protein [Candidatus Bathyarchaeota archaeon]|nr:cobalamin biosynthesis protein [Candidatus Bathyarchaeota archaeon]